MSLSQKISNQNNINKCNKFSIINISIGLN